MPDKPFFAYYAPGRHPRAAPRARRSGPTSTQGKFDQGWDKLREETFARQKELGVIPPDCDLTERSAGIPAWDDVAPEMRPVLARQMEVYAGYLENTDHHVGLLLDTLEDLGILDDTLIYVIIGDNGASAEGSLQGTFNEMITLGGFGALETAEFMSSQDRPLRRPRGVQPLRRRLGARDGHALPVDQAGRVALGRHAQRHDRALAAPASRPRVRSARSSTTSSTSPRPCWRRPACPRPTLVNGVQQKPIEGVSMALQLRRRRRRRAPRDAVLRDVRQPRHLPQGVDGGDQAPHAVGDRRSTPSCRPSTTTSGSSTTPTPTGPRPTTSPRSIPEKLAELQRLWLIEAVKYNVVPLDDRFVERGLPETAGRPTLIHGKQQAAVRRHGPPHRELGRDDEEHVVLDHRQRHGARRRRRRA